MALQDQQEQKKKKKKRQRQQQGPSLLSVKPRIVYRGHLVWFDIAGKNFGKNTWRSFAVSEGKVEDQRFESEEQIKLQVRVKPGAHNGVLSISLTGANEEETESPPTFVDPTEELAENEVLIIASPVEGTAIIADAGSADTRPHLALGITEVSNRQYLEFLNYIAITGDHSACHPDEASDKSHVPDRWDDKLLRAPDNPVTGLDWFDAYAYAAWKGYRLPTAEEWERAAGDTVYPWGDEPLPRNANTKETATMLTPSTSYRHGMSATSLMHMAGNAGEWVDTDGKGPSSAVIKGGSFKSGLLDARIKESSWGDKRDRRIDVGFRIAVDLTDERWDAKDIEEEEWLATLRGIPKEEPAVEPIAEDEKPIETATEESAKSDESEESPPEEEEQGKKKGGRRRKKKKKK